MYSQLLAGDSDSEGSLISDVSASPPRGRSPPPPPPPDPRPNPKHTTTVKPKPKPKPPKSKAKLKPAASAFTAAASPPPLPSAALSDPHGLVSRIAAAPALVAATSTVSSSFRRLVQSRNPSFDPAAAFSAPAPAPTPASTEIATAAAAQGPAPDAPPQTRPKRVHPNSVSEVAPAAAEQPKRPRGGAEGNFVRLNINGYGRRRTFRNAQARRPTKYRSWRRQRYGGVKPQSCGDEEGDLVAEALIEREKKGAVGDDGVLEAVEAAREDPSEQNLESLLRVVYGYNSFREGQLEAIQKVVAGESTMLVLPTGAGKSLCYQVPAMILPGLTLVVSPLLSLMVDQLRKLPAFLPGGLLASNQTRDEFHETLQRLRGGEIKVLFVSPERFLNEEFLVIFRDGLPISLVAIDEAHCISEWSHNFRPSYLRLRASLLRRKLNVQCILAMTATATTQTLEEIVTVLEIPSDNLIKTSPALLEDHFKEHSTLNPKQKAALARQLNLRPRQVEVWFQNRRARTKLKQTEVDCELLKRCCETLTEENRRLHRELQQLRALSHPHPAAFFMPAAAALSICPSCERLATGVSATTATTTTGADGHKVGGPGRAPHLFSPFTKSAAC